MKVSLKELRSGVCSHIDFDYTIDLSKEEVNFEFPFEKPVRFSGSISDMAGVLNLTADIDAQATKLLSHKDEWRRIVAELYFKYKGKMDELREKIKRETEKL